MKAAGLFGAMPPIHRMLWGHSHPVVLCQAPPATFVRPDATLAGLKRLPCAGVLQFPVLVQRHQALFSLGRCAFEGAGALDAFGFDAGCFAGVYQVSGERELANRAAVVVHEVADMLGHRATFDIASGLDFDGNRFRNVV